MIFDDQFQRDGEPARYWYHDFLGFSIARNAKILTKKFQLVVTDFIENNISSFENKQLIHDALRTELLQNQSDVVNPTLFGETFIPSDLKNKYSAEILSNELFINAFPKDVTLIKNQLNKKKIIFPDKLKLEGPANAFKERIEIYSSIEQLVEDVSDDRNDYDYTFLKIIGHPSNS